MKVLRACWIEVAHQWADLRDEFGQAISSFLPLISQISLPIGNKLDIFQKQHQVFDNRTKAIEDELLGDDHSKAITFENRVMEMPIAHSRAGLFIYINALVSSVRLLTRGDADCLACWETTDR